jgi:Spy/CpxP family protein refolding chaperone
MKDTNMKQDTNMKRNWTIAALTIAVAASSAFAASQYSGQESREIKALSPEDVRTLLAGNGMGLAKAAELNGYAGPMHVLELASQLHLTAEQRRRTQALFESMSAQAKAAGQSLVDKERHLDQLFSSRAVTPELLRSTLAEIGALQAQLRRIHLEAHLVQAEILSPEQNANYSALRGYAGGARGGAHQHRH